jgi:hypothetical protein
MTRRQTILALTVALALLAGGLRFYRLGAWPFATDESATLVEVDALVRTYPGPETSKYFKLPRLIPLGYLTNELGFQLFGRDEFGGRALMALVGTATVVVLFLALAGLLGTKAAFATAALVAVWPEHVFQSQQVRFYVTAGFCAAVCMLAGGLAARHRSRWFALLACLAALAAVLAHTLQGLLLVGLCAALVAAARAEGRPVPWAMLGLAAAAGLAALGYLGWYVWQFGAGWNSGEGWGYSLAHSMGAAFFQVGWPVACLAGLGLVGLLQRRDGLGWYWAAWLALWAVASVALPMAVVYHPHYTFPLALAVFVPAGYGVALVFDRLRPQNVGLACAWVAAACCLNFPSLASHYIDGSRYDYRTPAHFLAERVRPGDRIAAVSPGLLRLYAPACREAVRLPGWDPLPQLKEMTASARRLWIVLPTDRAGRPEELSRWLNQHCAQALRVRKQRYDYYEYVVEVYLYTSPAEVARTAGPGDAD